MSIEVYIIIFILAIPIFFLSRWILKKRVDVKRLNIFSLLATLILAPIIYIGLILIWVYSISYYPSNDFNKEKWLNNKEKRYELSEDIIDSKMLLGKSKSEIRDLLGKEGNTDDSDFWQYDLGFKPQLLGLDPDLLIIEFEDGKVINVEQQQG